MNYPTCRLVSELPQRMSVGMTVNNRIINVKNNYYVLNMA